jgi:nicotinamidase-related amidase
LNRPGAGSRPSVPKTALLIIDMLNPYDHEDADKLADSVREVLPRIVDLRERAQSDDDVVTIYVNDNHDQWDLDRKALVEVALDGEHPDLVEPIVPNGKEPFLAKGRHSVFYQTSLAHLLHTQEVECVVLVGQVTEQCILYSALDGYLRGYEIHVPKNAVAHIYPELAEPALHMMERNMHAKLDDDPF